MNESRGQPGEELLEAQPLREGALDAPALRDDRRQAEERNREHDQEDLEPEHALGGGNRHERSQVLGTGPDGDQRGGEERQARPGRAESHRGPEQEWQEERERRTRPGCDGALARKDEEGDGEEGGRQGARLDAPADRRPTNPRRAGRRQRQDGRNHGELGQDVRQEAGPPDDPVGLSASRGDERRIGEGGQEGREKDGSENEHHRAAQGIERRGIAEAAHEDGGDHGFAAVGDEETQYERRRPAGR